ncbi:hypothetical protein [Candidatus Palauibacter sp.]|uniref:hypothetical protein n=1 Tax=Candidatus Palauibacter sp. TaxID=3101350 RepID=UPI003AF243D6
MPNGGSDCCGTCWFNRANAGEAGSANHEGSVSSYCEIRDLPIPDPFYTYCSNHPYRLDRREPIPIGPVFTAADADAEREVWVEPPDTEEIRSHLLRLLAHADNPQDHYPFFGGPIPAIVARQLVEFREPRAIPILEHIGRELSRRGEEPDGIHQAIARIRGSRELDGPAERC